MADSNFISTVQRKRTMPHTLVLEHVSPATRLLEKRRQMFEVQEALEQQKQEFERKEEIFKRRENGLKKKDLDLQESLIRFSKFLQENDNKISKAEKKGNDEIKIRLQKEKEIQQLNKTLDELRAEKQEVQKIVEHNMRYQRYLESVLESHDELQEIQDLLMRQATLEATRQDLKQQQKKFTEQTEKVRGQLQYFTKQKTDEILSLNNQIAHLKQKLEGFEQESLALESKKDYSLQDSSKRTLEYGQVIMSTDHLYSRCRQRSKIGHGAETNPLYQLEVIGNFVSDLGFIVKQHKDILNKK